MRKRSRSRASDLGHREEVARPELEILEVEGRFLGFRLLVGRPERGQELLEQMAIGRSQDVEGRLLERAAGRLVRGESLLPSPAHGNGGEVDEAISRRCAVEQVERRRHLLPRIPRRRVRCRLL